MAVIAQRIKSLKTGTGRIFSNTQLEALDMIGSKLARILCGNPNEIDHWLDIAGYAQLVVNDLTKSKPIAKRVINPSEQPHPFIKGY